MAAYSMDLRKRVVRACDAGLDVESVAAKYEVSRAWVHRVLQRRRETGSIAPGGTRFRGRVLADQEERLRALIEAQPDATLAELRDALPTSAAVSTLWRAIRRLRLSVEKTVHADEQRRPDVAAARRQWCFWLPLRDARQYVVLDECGVATDLLRRYGRSPRGERLHDHTPCGHWQTHTIITALRLEGVTAPAVFDGPYLRATDAALMRRRRMDESFRWRKIPGSAAPLGRSAADEGRGNSCEMTLIGETAGNAIWAGDVSAFLKSTVGFSPVAA